MQCACTLWCRGVGFVVKALVRSHRARQQVCLCVARAGRCTEYRGRGAGGTPLCTLCRGSSTCGGSNSPVVIYLHVPRTTACLNGNLCFVCSTCDTAMDLLSAHATRLAPEQARLAPTAPHCAATVYTGAWESKLGHMAGRPPDVGDVAALAALCHLLMVPTSARMVSLVLGSMLAVAQLLLPTDAPGTHICR